MEQSDARWRRLVDAARHDVSDIPPLSEARLDAILAAAAARPATLLGLPRWCEWTAWCTLAASVVFALSLADYSQLETPGLVQLTEVCPWEPVP